VRRRGLSGSFWPTPTQESLLRLVLGGDELVAARWRALQPLDIDTLDVGSFCLLPHLFVRLQRALPDEPLLPRLAGTYRSTWYRNQLQLERLAGVVGELRTRGVDPIVFGGITLAARWYPQPGLRPIPQVDAVVSPGGGDIARDGMAALGWRPAGGGRGSDRYVNDESFVLVLHDGIPAGVAGPLDRRAAFASVCEAAPEHEFQNARVRILDAADELVFACALGARTLVPPTVQWLIDAACLLDRGGIDLDRVVARSLLLRVAAPMVDTLAYLEAVAPSSVPGPLQEAFRRRPPGRRDRYAYRLAGAGDSPFGGLPPALAHHLRATANQTPSHALGSLSRVALGKLRRSAGRARSGMQTTASQAAPVPGDHDREVDPSTERKTSALS
jgi:hypothetical protein